MKRLQFSAPRMDRGLDMNDARNLKLGQISSGKSARLYGTAIGTGPGYRLAKDLSTNDEVYLHTGTVFPLLWAKSGTKIYYSTDALTFYDTGVTVTAAETGYFVEQGNGDMYYFNQTDTPIRFALAYATVAIADTDIIITVGADQIAKFAASGNVYCEGDTIPYTGVTATTLTGVTAIATGGHAINSILMQFTNPATFVEEKGTFGFELESRMVIGGVKYKENILHGSAPETEKTPQYFYDFDANGEMKRALSGKLTAGIKGQGRAFVFTNNSVYQLLGFDVATGAFLMGTGPINEFYGAYNPRCVVNMDGVCVFFGNKRLMPINLTLSADGSLPAFEERFDAPLRPWLDSLDQAEDQIRAGLHFDQIQKVLKITGRRNGVYETYVYHREENAFMPEEQRNPASFALFNGVSYMGSIDGKIHRDDYGRTSNGITMLHKWATGRMEYEKGRTYMQCQTLEYDGFMSQACAHTLNIYLDGSTVPDAVFTFDDSVITSTQGTPLGARGIGGAQIGGEVDAVSVYPYKINLLLVGLGAEDVKVEWVVSKEGAFLSVNSFLLVTDITRFSQRTFS